VETQESPNRSLSSGKAKFSKKRIREEVETGQFQKVKKGKGTTGRKSADKTFDPTSSSIAPTYVDQTYSDTISIKRQPEPEPDPEKSLDGDSTGATTTVHWNPHSSAGQKVGYRVRIYHEPTNKWRNGRVLRYDPVSHKHKIDFTSEKHKKNIIHGQDRPQRHEWVDLKDFYVYISGRFVWALVKGYAWWPAQVLTYEQPINAWNARLDTNTNPDMIDRKDIFSEPPRDGYLLVEFFDSGEVASVKDSSESIRPFRHGRMDDPIMKKNKKRPSTAAIEQCKKEEDMVRTTRNDAARYYAQKAFAFVNKAANYLLGRKVQFFRGDLNYPQGEHVVGTIRQ
jgi:hypothetical protein